MRNFAAVMLGSAVGGAARYAVALLVAHRFPYPLPVATFVVNVGGCFAIGLLATLFAERWPGAEPWRLFAVVGLLGGFTTYSTFGWETWKAVRDGFGWVGLINVVSTVAAGYLAVWAGAALGRR